uniref:ATP synthase subunit d, mitochondrial n=1 Tax=Callithrix jacchus TaxID=9483 RepID=A0A8I3W6D8_CALJA
MVLQFNALKVPIPEDPYTALVDAEEKEDVKSCAEWVSLSKARVVEYEKKMEKYKNLIPFEQKTIEDLNEAFPETKLDKQKYPYWPHQPIENL